MRRDDNRRHCVVTEEIAATPGWVDERLDELFAKLPQGVAVAAAREEYSGCLAGDKAPAAPSDMMGEEFASCRGRLDAALQAADVDAAARAQLDSALQALEAEIDEDS